MSEQAIIGYRLVPIFEKLPGMITTQAFILCCHCHSAISSTGGPSSKSVCLTCAEGILGSK